MDILLIMLGLSYLGWWAGSDWLGFVFWIIIARILFLYRKKLTGELRIALDGHSYNYASFVEHYGKEGHALWSQASSTMHHAMNQAAAASTSVTSTSVTKPISKQQHGGATTLEVTSITGFKVGDTIHICDAKNKLGETDTIKTITIADARNKMINSIVVVTPLKNSYPIGATVQAQAKTRAVQIAHSAPKATLLPNAQQKAADAKKKTMGCHKCAIM